MKARVRKSGFTLVEILIVVIILGILAAIIIPQFTDASTDAKQSSLDSNMQTLQSQFELYKVQHNDQYPWDSDVDPEVEALDTNTNIELKLTSKTDADGTINAAGRFGPYMQNVAGNPFCNNAEVAFSEAVGTVLGSVDWVIDIATGAITSGHPSYPASSEAEAEEVL
jgi:general secretion pathway protein G